MNNNGQLKFFESYSRLRHIHKIKVSNAVSFNVNNYQASIASFMRLTQSSF